MKRDENGIVIPAALQGHDLLNQQAHYGEGREGYAVAEAYELSRCNIDLKIGFEGWPMPEHPSSHLDGLSRSILGASADWTDVQRNDWLRTSVNAEKATELIIQAIVVGDLSIWVASSASEAGLLPASILRAIDERSVTTGLFIPSSIEHKNLNPSKKHKFWEQRLFVKKADWVNFKNRLFDFGEHGQRPALSNDDIVKWCEEWISTGKGNGMDKAWGAFKSEPQHQGLSRDDCFRPAWKEAKNNIIQ
jgi:hypothetical protein